MNATIHRLPWRDDTHGNCPICGRTDGYTTVIDGDGDDRNAHYWFVCAKHKTKWLATSNEFDYSDEEPARSAHRLANFRTVAPLFVMAEGSMVIQPSCYDADDGGAA